MDAVEAKPYSWLWRDRIPQEGLAILNGKPDVGKSTIYTDIAARVTRGACMPPEDGWASAVLVLDRPRYCNEMRRGIRAQQQICAPLRR